MDGDLDGLKILVVEDEYLVATLIQDVLEAAGCVVLGPIPRLDEAIDAARAGLYDAAVLDVNLGGNRVFPVADALSDRHIPFVFVTGYGTGSLPPEHHAQLTIRKPFRNDDLLSALAELVHRNG